LQFAFQPFLLVMKARYFFLGHFGKLGIRGIEQLPVLFQVAQDLEIILPKGDQVFQSRVFTREFLRALVILKNLGIIQRRLNFREAPFELFDMWP